MADATNHGIPLLELEKRSLSPPPSLLLSLPAEIRIQILEHVFEENLHHNGFSLRFASKSRSGINLDETYTASRFLEPLLVCKTFYREGNLMAMNCTHFVVTNLFFRIPERLTGRLHPKQIQAIRNIAFVADDRHFRSLIEWQGTPFGMQPPGMFTLDTLTIVLHRTNFWHYLFDFTGDMVKLLRTLQGVRKFVIVKNAALVKGSLKTWYNRLIGLILKADHQQRYESFPPQLEKTWWEWEFDDGGQRILLEARDAKAWVEEEEYMQQVLPLMEKLRESVESEEWNPDPRARNHYY